MIVCEFNVSHVGNDSKAVQDAAAAKVLGGRSPDCARRVLPRDSEGEAGLGAGAARDGVLAPFGELLGALGDPGVEAGPDRADGSRGNLTKDFSMFRIRASLLLVLFRSLAIRSHECHRPLYYLLDRVG